MAHVIEPHSDPLNALPAPLTRREAREREAAAALVGERAALVEVPVREARAITASRGVSRFRDRHQPRMTKRKAAQLSKAAVRPAREPRRGTSVASKLLSTGALLFAGALVIGMSVPANAFMTDASEIATGDASTKTRGQSIEVASTAVEPSAARDSFEVISYAQVLALKYAGIDYSYSVTSGAVRWPFPYAVPITDGFGDRDGGFHKGVDFVPGGGTPIYAIADGVVTTATYDNSGYGQHVIIAHSLGGVKVDSLYGHMIADSSPVVVGQEIKVGDFLGLVGDTGVAYGEHLHFELHVNGLPVDPFAWLQANAVN